jgi:hypothetical protein
MIATGIEANRVLIARAFPGRAAALDAWIRSPAATPPVGPTLVLVDPASRRRRWLRSAMPPARRTPPAYRDYADAACRLRSPCVRRRT